MGSFLQRRAGACPADKLGSTRLPAEEDVRAFPALAEFLAASTWEDGAPRVTGSMLLFFESGRWKACLSDREQGLVAFLTLPSLSSALSCAEEALRDQGLEWRAKREDGGARRGR